MLAHNLALKAGRIAQLAGDWPETGSKGNLLGSKGVRVGSNIFAGRLFSWTCWVRIAPAFFPTFPRRMPGVGAERAMLLRQVVFIRLDCSAWAQENGVGEKPELPVSYSGAMRCES